MQGHAQRHLRRSAALLTAALAACALASASAQAAEPRGTETTNGSVVEAQTGRLTPSATLHRPDIPRSTSHGKLRGKATSSPTTGGISGRLTGPAGDALAGGYVGVWSRTTAAWVQWGTTTGDGTYLLSGLPADSYALCFQGPSDGNLSPECWKDEPFIETADPIRVWPGRTVTGRNARLDETGQVSGYISFADQPMATVNITAYLSHGGWRYMATAATDASGRFQLDGLFPGTYGLALDQCCATIEASGSTSVGLAWGDGKGRVLATVRPSISGTAAVGSLLKAKVGSGKFAGLALSYQWLRNGVEVPNAIGSSYRVGAEDVGAALSVLAMSARSGDGSTLAGQSRATPRVALADTPTVGGEAKVGATLTAVPGTWTEGTTFRYQWLASGRTIKGATGADYVVSSSRNGKRISVKVTGALAGHPTLTRTSAATAKVMRWTRPAVGGAASAGARLSASRGTWSSRVSFRYQWLRNGSPITSATRSTYRLTGEDVGAVVTVRLTGKRSGYTTVAAESTSAGRVTVAGTPSVSGVVAVGRTLTAQPGEWTAGTSFTYEWFADGKRVAGPSTSDQYAPSAADAGRRITVRVTGSQDGWATVRRSSAATSRVMRWTAPAVTGQPGVGQRLGVSRGRWTTGASFTYQWARDGVPVPGATRSTFDVTAEDAGGSLTVTITGRRSGYATVSATSVAAVVSG